MKPCLGRCLLGISASPILCTPNLLPDRDALYVPPKAMGHIAGFCVHPMRLAKAERGIHIMAAVYKTYAARGSPHCRSGPAEPMRISKRSRRVNPRVRMRTSSKHDVSWTLGVSIPYPQCTAFIDTNTGRHLANMYLEGLRKLSRDSVRVTDKLPGNFMHLGLIALILPTARIIHCQRHPLDVC